MPNSTSPVGFFTEAGCNASVASPVENSVAIQYSPYLRATSKTLRQCDTRREQCLFGWVMEHRLPRPHAPEGNGKVEQFLNSDEECFAVRRARSSPGRIGA